MGQQYSAPKPGTTLRVIGAGLPRTGTASFGRALEMLLDGPVYHGGTQVTLGPEAEIKTWIKVLSRRPPRDEHAHRANLDLIRARTTGYAAIADSPGAGVVAELMALYPDAKVVATVRDIQPWEDSMKTVAGASTRWFLRVLLFPVPAMRHFVDYIDALRDQWLYMYGETEPPTRKSYNTHMAWLRDNVPADRLVLYDVRDGWGPLCQALGLPVPKDVPFPQINDSKAIDAFARRQANRGLARWGVIFATVGAAVAAVTTAKRWL